MTYQDDWEIIKNSGKSLAAATVDASVALVQDVANVGYSLYANAVNNFATQEEWQNKFDGFWGKAWGKQGGIKDMLIDLANETFEDIFFGSSSSSQASITAKGDIKFIKDILDSSKSKVNFGASVLGPLSAGVDFTSELLDIQNALSTKFSKGVLSDFETPDLRKWVILPKFTLRPSFKKNKFKINNYKFSAKRDYSVNSAIDEIYKAGPLLFSNMFDVAFVIRKRHKDAKDEPISQKDIIVFLKNEIDAYGDVESEVRDTLFNTSDFSVRCASVSIPMAAQQTFQYKFLETSVERPNSSVSFENQSSLNIDMDANLYYLDFFQSLAGFRPHYGYSKLGKRVWSDTPNQAANLIGNKDYILDVVVTSRTLNSWHPLKYNPTSEGGDWANICYIFQDAKFLGTDKIKFSRDSNTVQTCSFDFVFRSLETLYKNNEKMFKAPESLNENVIFNGRLGITDLGLDKQAMEDTRAGKDIYRKF